MPYMKTAEFVNNIDPDEAAHDEPPHLGLHCLRLIFELPISCSLNKTFFENLQM